MCVSPEQGFGLGHHVLHGEAELLHAGATRSGSTKAVHGDAVAIEANEAVPAEGFGGFHHDALADCSRQNLLLVGIALLIEELHAGHGDHAHLLAFSGELFGGLNAEVKLGAGADQDQLRGAVAVLKDVAAMGDFLDRGVGLVGHALAAEAQSAGAMTVLDGQLVGTAGFVAITRTEHQHVGDGPQRWDGLDWLVGWAVFTDANGVVGEHVDHTQLAEG